jgi:hypothetical protein
MSSGPSAGAPKKVAMNTDVVAVRDTAVVRLS